MKIFVVATPEVGLRLDVYVCAHLKDELSRSRVRKLIDSGDVLLNDASAKAGTLLRESDRIRVVVPPSIEASPLPQAMELDVVWEDADLAVINKPAGLVVHPGAGTPDGTLVNALLARDGQLSSIGGVFRPGIVHRLDKDTSGLMVVARNDFSHRILSEALSRHDIARVYHAITLRTYRENSGRIEAPIGRHPSGRTRMAIVHEKKGGRPAVTHWKIIEQMGSFALVECRLETGRTHQIRVHMAHEGHPLLGDELYGGGFALASQFVPAQANKLRAKLHTVQRQMLHARQLAFTHPRTGEAMSFKAEPPADFMDILTALRGAAQIMR
ncbi:RNA pseudouridine synthase [candidate division BRC1 bacterium HGW-BRC1-1]|jgi:23S rRNA pseudouridine1911/1915/1917 synthase|nr:MAG: RNA pseudouridine synthase [candidate division BRC1 bacterium HGW-BRC1-1]